MVYDFADSRAGRHAQAFLGDWRGTLICDDYAGCKALIAQVAGDVISLEVDDPEAAVAGIARSFQLQARIADGRVLIERERGHELIPRLVEALPAGSIRALSMHRPTLADVFVKLTGRALGQDQEQGRAP